MNQGMMNTVVAAIVGGIVGAGVVFFAGNNKVDLDNLEVKNLKVAAVTITEMATLLNAEGNPELFIRDGSILAEKVILGNKIVGQQLQGHAIVGNRIFATPDNLVNTPMEQWRFYAEMGASLDAGGEIVVRSLGGHAMVGKPTTGGALLRQGFTPEGLPQTLAIHNANRSPMSITHELSDQQRQQIMSSTAANPAAMMPQPNLPGNFNGTTAPVNGSTISSNPTGVQ